MLDYFTALFQYFLNLSPVIYILGIFFISIAENLFPPVPGDTILVFSVVVFTRHDHSLSILYAGSVLGSVVGFMMMFAIGYHWGRDYFYTKNFPWMPVIFLERVSRRFQRHGYHVIAWNRFIPGMRSVIALFAGMSHLSRRLVFLLLTFSTILWNGLLATLGIILGENWRRISHILRNYNIIVFGLLLIILGLWLYRRLRHYQSFKKGV